MATKTQIIANRRNAKKSTGPRTTEGKAIVSQNAVKHGLSAARTVISSENQADFDLYRDRMLAELIPDSPVQSMLAERIISLSWRLKRAINIQNQTIDALNKNDKSPFDKLTQSVLARYLGNSNDTTRPDNTNEPCLALGRMAIKDFSNSRVLDRLLMYERRLEHSLYKTIIELQRLQLIKKLSTESEMSFNKLNI